MRRTINVLWLDDNSGEDVSTMQDAFKEALLDNGYLASFIDTNTVQKAIDSINDKSKRIDFFVSDFNLEESKTGIDFLIDLRKQGKLKEHLVLYSNAQKRTIRSEIKKIVDNDTSSIDYLSNYSFFSTGTNFSRQRVKGDFLTSIDVALNRWNELSALRGEHASLNTLAHSLAQNILYIITGQRKYRSDKSPYYADCIKELKNLIDNGTLATSFSSTDIANIFIIWKDCKDVRNNLEHNTEKWDTASGDFLIETHDGSSRIFEKDVPHERKKLINQMQRIKELIDDLISSNTSLASFDRNSDDYVNFDTIF